MTNNKTIQRRSNNQAMYLIKCNDGRTLKVRSEKDLKRDIKNLDCDFDVLKNVEGTSIYVSPFVNKVV